MKINPEIFKGYDIRGKYPEEINEEVACRIGQAFINFIKRRRKFKKLDILVGRDNRLSSSLIFKGLCQGFISRGVNVYDLGVCTTPMFYFASSHYRFDDGGIMITASHLPKEYNGFKIIKDVPIPIDYKTGLKTIKKEAVSKDIFGSTRAKGRVFKKNVLKEYVRFNLKEFNLDKIAPLKIVIDTGNASTGLVVPEMFKKTKCKIFHLFPKLDGNFPNRPLDCVKKGSLRHLKGEILKRKADLGIAFDGDGDRVVFVDEKGKLISPNVITALIAKILLRENQEETILTTVRGSRIISDVVREAGGKLVVWQVGHSNIKRKMRKKNILFGGEASGHYYLRNHYFSEAPFFVIFKILETMSKTGESVSGLVKPFQKYFHSGEINFKVKNKKRAMMTLENKFKKGKVSKIDGLRVDFSDWWFNVRLSNTEPLLRLVVEAKSRWLMEKKKKELIKLITPFFF